MHGTLPGAQEHFECLPFDGCTAHAVNGWTPHTHTHTHAQSQ